MRRRRWIPPDVWHPAIVSEINNEPGAVTFVFTCDAPLGEHRITRYELKYRDSIYEDPDVVTPELGDTVRVNFVREDWKPA